MAISMAAQLHTICNLPFTTCRPSHGIAITFISSSNRSLMVVASKAPKNVQNSSNTKDTFTSQEDNELKYLLKLGGGSVLGAAAIKYGSVVFPEITRPNILQALLMILAPLVIYLLLLISKSRRLD